MGTGARIGRLTGVSEPSGNGGGGGISSSSRELSEPAPTRSAPVSALEIPKNFGLPCDTGDLAEP